MLRQWIAVSSVILGIVVPTGLAQGQQNRSDSDPSLFERMENFGRNIFGGRNTPNQRSNAATGGDNDGSMHGSGSSGNNGYVRHPYGNSSSGRSTAARTQSSSAAANLPADPKPMSRAPAETAEEPAPAASETPAEETASGDSQSPAALHQRMSAFRDSVFGDSESEKSDKPIARVATSRAAASASVVSEANTAESALTKDLPEPAAKSAEAVPAPPSASETAVKSRPEPAAPPAAPPAADADAPAPAAERADRQPAASARHVLLARHGPNLSAETIGPQRISVGKESTYELSINNSGQGAAEELVVLVSLPTWAEVLGADGSVGTAQVVPLAQDQRQLQWKVGRLEPNRSERLVLRIRPLESRPFELGVKWDYHQVAAQAAIEVQEPKLALSMDGPRDVLYGKRERYRLKVANIGTGEAENASIRLHPLGAGDQGAAAYTFGTIPAGEERAIEVELTARQAGTLTVKVEVQCDGGIRAELNEAVVVRRAELQLEATAPRFLYVDAPAVYHLRIRNPGTAPAHDVQVTAVLPPGAKLLSASDDGRFDHQARQLRWRLSALPPGAERVLEARCTLGQAGDCPLDVQAVAGDELRATASAKTRVEAIAELALDVQDPKGPVAVGEDAVYELTLHNRGTKDAPEIEVAVYFSQGIEPLSAEGGAHHISPGQISFQPLAGLPAGKELKLKVVARAQAAGNHVCRSEVHCRPLGTRLVREETTYFYLADGDTAPNATADLRATRRSSATADPGNLPSPAVVRPGFDVPPAAEGFEHHVHEPAEFVR